MTKIKWDSSAEKKLKFSFESGRGEVTKKKIESDPNNPIYRHILQSYAINYNELFPMTPKIVVLQKKPSALGGITTVDESGKIIIKRVKKD